MDVAAGVSISRRAVLAAAAGGSAVVVAKTVLGPSPLLAAFVDGPGGVLAVDRATILAGTSEVKVEPGVDITHEAVVVCSLLSDPGPRSIHYVEIPPEEDWYKVHLTGRARTDVTVGCAVIVDPFRPGPISPPISPPISGPISPPISGGAVPPG